MVTRITRRSVSKAPKNDIKLIPAGLIMMKKEEAKAITAFSP